MCDCSRFVMYELYQVFVIVVFFYIVDHLSIFSFFFFNDTATTEIYTLSLHDALPISSSPRPITMSYEASRCSEMATRSSATRSEEHTSELQSQSNLVCRLLLEKKKNNRISTMLSQISSNTH